MSDRPHIAPLRDVGSDTPTRRIERPQSADETIDGVDPDDLDPSTLRYTLHLLGSLAHTGGGWGGVYDHLRGRLAEAEARRLERPQPPDASRSDGAGVAAPPPAGRDTAAEPPSEVAE